MIVKGPSRLGANFRSRMFCLRFLASSQTLSLTSKGVNVDPVFHGLLCQFVHSKCIVSQGGKVSKMFFQGRKVSGLNDVRDGLWFIPQHEVEWGFAGGMGAMIVDQFCHGNVCPCFEV